MGKFFLPFSLVLTIALGAFGQSAKPTPTPSDDGDVVKITTNLIQLDVTVTDPKGKVVTDLKPGEIEIYENGKKQKITNFSFVSSIHTPAEKTVRDKNAVPIPQQTLRAAQIKRAIALVADDLSMSFESVYYARRAIKKYVDEQMQPGDLVAIIRTGAGIGALQQFTADKQILYAAIDRIRFNPQGSGKVSPFSPEDPLLTAEPSKENKNARTADDNQNSANEIEDSLGAISVRGTLGALRYVITGMDELPGRKSVILFSDGIPLTERDRYGATRPTTSLVGLNSLVDAANRASVVIYTIDARGLPTGGITAAEHVENSGAIPNLILRRNDELKDTQQGLSILAAGTGGFDFKNNNDLSSGVRRVLEDQSYYLIGYEPDADTFDPARLKFNRLNVKITRPDVTVHFRNGFMNVAERKKGAVPATNRTPAYQIAKALTSPFGASGISVKLNAFFGNDAKTGSYVRSLLHIDVKDLTFVDQPDGSKKANFSILAISFNERGEPVEQLAKIYGLAVPGKMYDKMQANGVVYQFAFPVKSAGPYQFRVAIRDIESGKIGAASQFVNVPAFKKDKLTLSGLVLDTLSQEQWQQKTSAEATYVSADPMTSTSLRRVKPGTVLTYGLEVYGAKMDAAKKPDLQQKIRVFSSGKMIMEGSPIPIDIEGQTDLQRIRVAGAVSLGKQMPLGDYILQIIVTDQQAKAGRQIATQFIEFEVVD